MTGRRVQPPTPAEVTNLLRAVIDPELGDNIVDLGMATGVTELGVDNGAKQIGDFSRRWGLHSAASHIYKTT